jgi:transposase InsO family protein
MPWETQNLMNKRTEFAMKALHTENFAELCREYGISRKIGYKWRDRFLAQGLGGMKERSRRPVNSPEKLEPEVIYRIVQLKERHRNWGPKKLREVDVRQQGSGPSESSFKRVLEKCGLVDKRVVRAMERTGRIASGRKAKAPNEVWTVDFKGWWYDRDGRWDPLTVRDEYSRCVLELRALPDAKTKTVQRCFERLFERHGLPGAMRSDNGPPFASVHGLLGLTQLSAWWLAHGIDLERSRPGCPQDNGGHERLHRDIARELEGSAYEERQAAFDTWRREFNHERPHEALGMKCPAEIYHSSERAWTGTPAALEYPEMAVRRVHQKGAIQWEGQPVFLSGALSGWDVGLRARGAGLYEVYFARLCLGVLEGATASFRPTGSETETEETTP